MSGAFRRAASAIQLRSVRYLGSRAVHNNITSPLLGRHGMNSQLSHNRSYSACVSCMQDSNPGRSNSAPGSPVGSAKNREELIRVANETLEDVRKGESGRTSTNHEGEGTGASAGDSTKAPAKKTFRFAVDRSGLLAGDQFDALLHDASKETDPNAVPKEAFTPLGAELTKYIALKGPIPISDYMMQCLNHSTHGYYHSNSDKIGKEGDFITSPEISQVFGECIAVWCMSTWEILGKPKAVNLVELGPGNGTLMSDILRASKKFPAFSEALTIHFVERSQDLRKAQFDALKCREETMKNGLKRFVSDAGATVAWHDTVDALPDDKALLVIGQEFLDAFPINQFVFNDGRWREKLVDINENSKSPFNFRFVLSPIDTPTSKMLESGTLKQIIDNSAAQSKAAAASSEASGVKGPSAAPVQGNGARLHELMRAHEANLDASNMWMIPSQKNPSVNETASAIEICPGALSVVDVISRKIASAPAGAALFIDYGEDYSQSDTLRGFRKHKQEHVLSKPGECDITADVDFSALRAAAQFGTLKSKLSVVGPTSQASFLFHMGIVHRMHNLISLSSTSEEQAVELYNSFEFLVGKEGMGEKFKVISIISNQTV